MKLVWTYLKKYPKWLILDVLGAFTFVVVNLGLPTALARMIDQGITTGNKDKVYFWAIVMFIVIIVGAIGRVTLAYAAGKITTNMIKDMRNDMYDKLQEYSHHEYEQIGVSSLVTRMTSDAFILMQFAEQSLRMGVVTPLMIIFSVVMILVTSPSLAWIVAVAIPFLVLVVYYVATHTRPLSENNKTLLIKLTNMFVKI